MLWRGRRRRRPLLGLRLVALTRVLVTDRGPYRASLGEVVPGDGLPEQWVYVCPVPDCRLDVTRTGERKSPDRAATRCGHPREARAVFLFRSGSVEIAAESRVSGTGLYLYVCPGRTCGGPALKSPTADSRPRCASREHGRSTHRTMALALSA
ncbi:hypothetical protein AB0F07_31845 [Streptomyces fructofermentans]|uniref:hypothetical protein n=1 Tax=Streptomyces fructofermentans TaxID=152141 RepID=UPI0033D35711